MSMVALLFGLSAQASVYIGTDVPIPDPVPELTEVPRSIVDRNSCVCPANTRADVTFTGYVIDAEVILGADRQSVEDRMATIFDVKYSDDSKIHDRTRVWHDVSADKCGVTFDYGKKYTVAARWGENGDLETDRCLLGE